MTVSPLDGAREWDVPAAELEAGWKAVGGGAELDGLASIRLQEAGVGSAHPEYVAGLLQAITGRWKVARNVHQKCHAEERHRRDSSPAGSE